MSSVLVKSRSFDSFIGVLDSSVCNPLEIVNSLVSLLTDKEARVISARFGLDGQQVRTLASLGTELGVTRERIRQVQAHAIKKMQRNSDSYRYFKNAFRSYEVYNAPWWNCK